MTAGIPGTGITAIFYLLLVLLMPVRELYLMLRGRSRPGRWRVILTQSALAWGIVALLWGEGWVLGRLFVAPAAPAAGAGRWEVLTHNLITVSALGVALATFIMVVLLIHLLRLLVGRPVPASSPAPASPPAAAGLPEDLPEDLEPNLAVGGSAQQ